jgi:hypothetical protein
LRYGRDRSIVEAEITKRAKLAADATENVEKKAPPPPSLPFQ